MKSLKQLEAFYWAATSASFVVAADRLHVTQSSLSKRIKELEQQFGRELFDRSGHRAVLTEAGMVLLPLARRLLTTADELRSIMAEDSSVRGHCRLGVGELTSLTWLPDFVALARSTYPELVLEPSVDIGSALEQRVDGGILDFAVIASASTRASVASQPLGEVRYRWAGARSLVGEGAALSNTLLQKVCLITMPSGAGGARLVDEWLLANGYEPRRRVTCNSMAAIAGLAMAGVGIGLFPEPWLAHLVRQGRLVELASEGALPPLHYHLHWRRDDSRPVMARLREMASSVADYSRPNALWENARAEERQPPSLTGGT